MSQVPQIGYNTWLDWYVILSQPKDFLLEYIKMSPLSGPNIGSKGPVAILSIRGTLGAGRGCASGVTVEVMCCWCFLFIIVLENCIAVHLWHRSELWKAIYIYSAFMLVNAIFCIWARVVYWRRPSKCSPEEQTGGSYHSCREVTHCYAALDSEDSDSAQSDKSEREV